MVPGGGGRVRGAARGAEDLGRLAQCNNAFLRTKLNACPIGSLLSPVGNASVTARSAAFRVHQPLSPPAPSAPSRSLSSASSRIAPPLPPSTTSKFARDLPSWPREQSRRGGRPSTRCMGSLVQWFGFLLQVGSVSFTQRAVPHCWLKSSPMVSKNSWTETFWVLSMSNFLISVTSSCLL